MVDPLLLVGLLAVVSPLTANECVRNANLTVTDCYQCSNFDEDGIPFGNCPLDGEANTRAYSGPCQGKCFTRTDDQNLERVVRGCTVTQWGLPDPLPSDGCYQWYTTVWCVCTTPKCNGDILGEPSETEFDIAAQEECPVYDDNSAVASPLSHAVVAASSCLFFLTYFKMTS